MPKFKSFFLLLAIAVSVVAGCNPDETNTTPVSITSIKNNIRPDSAVNPPVIISSEVQDIVPDSTDVWLYYSFETDAVVPAALAGTDEWDIKFRYVPFDKTGASFQKIFTTEGAIFLNSPDVGNAAGKTTGYIADTSFTLLSTGDDTKFRSDDTAKGKQIISFTPFYIYDGAAHTASPNPSKTLVIRTSKGKYVKLQLQSIYKNHPAVPKITDEVGYYTFKYVKSTVKSFINDGSPDGWLYYSFDTESVISSSQSHTSAWDIKFRFIANDITAAGKLAFSDIFVKSGAIFLNSPLVGNSSGKTKGYIADQAFEQVTLAGDDSKFRSDDINIDTRIIPVTPSGTNAYINYNSSVPSVIPNPDKTLIIRTANGKYVKMKLVSLYKDKPTIITSADLVGYYSFQYLKSDTKTLH
ncbi:MAG: HmuY family protein [Ignavibacteria bacterium]|nr:HmuY family protein [Ignavibacteria bacterium]